MFNFRVSELPSESNYDPLEPGEYEAVISEVSLNATRDQTGQLIKIKWRIEGPKGRVVYDNLNIVNDKPSTQQQGRAKLGALMRATGLQELTSVDPLLNRRAKVVLVVKSERTDPATGKIYPASNDVKTYKGLSGSIPPGVSTAARQPGPPSAQAASSSKPVWARAKAPPPPPVEDQDDIPY